MCCWHEIISGYRIASGPGVIFSFLLAGVITLLIAFVFAEFGSYIPHTGGCYTYVYFAVGELPAFLTGWLQLISKYNSLLLLSVCVCVYVCVLFCFFPLWSFCVPFSHAHPLFSPLTLYYFISILVFLHTHPFFDFSPTLNSFCPSHTHSLS